MLSALVLASVFTAVTAPAIPTPKILYVQPLGNCGSTVRGMEQVQGALAAFFPIEVRLLPCQALPTSAYYKPRRRYRADTLLDYLKRRMPKDGWRVLGLTAVDISTTKDDIEDWGILGLGELPGTATVISSFRCKKKSRGPAHAIERLAKVAVHEIGHTLGLDHCPAVGCLMEDAKGKVATCDREQDFCPRCRAMAAKNGLVIATNPPTVWLKGH